MKHKIYYPLIMSIVLFLTGCVADETVVVEVDTREKILNKWNILVIDEIDPSGQRYQSTIYKDAVEKNKIFITNFHGLGGTDVFAYVSGKTITLPEQTTAKNKVVGTGIISSTYTEINWNYTVDEGNGPMVATAVFKSDLPVKK